MMGGGGEENEINLDNSNFENEIKVIFEIRNNREKWQNVRLSYKLWEIFSLLFRNEHFFKEITSSSN